MARFTATTTWNDKNRNDWCETSSVQTASKLINTAKALSKRPSPPPPPPSLFHPGLTVGLHPDNLHIHIATITTIIIHNLLSSGLVAQLVEQRTIKAGGCGLDSRRGRIFFFCFVQSPISLLGPTLSGKFMLLLLNYL